MRTTVMTVCGAAILTMVSSAAFAEFDVKRADNVPGLKRGDVIADDATLELPKDAEIELYKRPSGPTYTLKGPYEGTQARLQWSMQLVARDVRPLQEE